MVKVKNAVHIFQDVVERIGGNNGDLIFGKRVFLNYKVSNGQWCLPSDCTCRKGREAKSYELIDSWIDFRPKYNHKN